MFAMRDINLTKIESRPLRRYVAEAAPLAASCFTQLTLPHVEVLAQSQPVLARTLGRNLSFHA